MKQKVLIKCYLKLRFLRKAYSYKNVFSSVCMPNPNFIKITKMALFQETTPKVYGRRVSVNDGVYLNRFINGFSDNFP